MNITVIGTGYIGLVTGTCLAEVGNRVICVDLDESKINGLKKGVVPIYEPGLDELVQSNYKNGLLDFTTDLNEAIQKTEILFIAVGTPPGEDGSADLQYVLAAARDIGRYMNEYKVVVQKSTVPVGTAEKVRKVIRDELDKRNKELGFDVVSNPEFLKEGSAVKDFMEPDRIIVGVDKKEMAVLMEELYKPFICPLIVMDIPSAEITKYAANAMLATRISFMNEIAEICEKTGADIENVKLGIGADLRIGNKFLNSGIGYGGSCLPKDVKALLRTVEEIACSSVLIKAVNEVNRNQRKKFINKIFDHLGGQINGKTFTVWGLAFKPGTDDMREAPSVEIIHELLAAGAKIRTFDPVAMEEASKIFGTNDNLTFCSDMYMALHEADALILVTEWPAFKNPDFEKIKSLMRQPVIFDGRNQYNPSDVRAKGFIYYSVGRQ